MSYVQIAARSDALPSWVADESITRSRSDMAETMTGAANLAAAEQPPATPGISAAQLKMLEDAARSGAHPSAVSGALTSVWNVATRFCSKIASSITWISDRFTGMD